VDLDCVGNQARPAIYGGDSDSLTLTGFDTDADGNFLICGQATGASASSNLNPYNPRNLGSMGAILFTDGDNEVTASRLISNGENNVIINDCVFMEISELYSDALKAVVVYTSTDATTSTRQLPYLLVIDVATKAIEHNEKVQISGANGDFGVFVSTDSKYIYLGVNNQVDNAPDNFQWDVYVLDHALELLRGTYTAT
jgi:hypothetical protein